MQIETLCHIADPRWLACFADIRCFYVALLDIRAPHGSIQPERRSVRATGGTGRRPAGGRTPWARDWAVKWHSITGAASGIGAATARLFAREGAKVVVADVMVEQGEKVVSEIRSDGGEATFVRCDVTNPDDVKAAIDLAVRTYGRLDVLHNNAGIEGPQAETANYPESDFERVINVNLKGVYFGLKYGVQAMLANGGGSIINTASVAGLVGFPGLLAYNASKGAVIQMTRTAALEYAKQGIRINAIAPGVIETPMVQRLLAVQPEAYDSFLALEPIGRFATPEEVAQVALFLASDDSSFVTGSVSIVDGGLTAM